MKRFEHEIKVKIYDEDDDEGFEKTRSFEGTVQDIITHYDRRDLCPGELEWQLESTLGVSTETDDEDFTTITVYKKYLRDGLCEIIKDDVNELIDEGFLYENFDVYGVGRVESVTISESDISDDEIESEITRILEIVYSESFGGNFKIVIV